MSLRRRPSFRRAGCFIHFGKPALDPPICPIDGNIIAFGRGPCLTTDRPVPGLEAQISDDVDRIRADC